jgi:hypothetical protein
VNRDSIFRPTTTGIIACAMRLFATTNAEQMLQLGKMAAVIEVEKPRSGRLADVGVT